MARASACEKDETRVSVAERRVRIASLAIKRCSATLAQQQPRYCVPPSRPFGRAPCAPLSSPAAADQLYRVSAASRTYGEANSLCMFVGFCLPVWLLCAYWICRRSAASLPRLHRCQPNFQCHVRLRPHLEFCSDDSRAARVNCWTAWVFAGHAEEEKMSQTIPLPPDTAPQPSRADPWAEALVITHKRRAEVRESRRDSDLQPRVGAERLPWVCGPIQWSQPQRGCGLTVALGRNPLGVENRSISFPRVGAARQPWAILWNCFGILRRSPRNLRVMTKAEAHGYPHQVAPRPLRSPFPGIP